MELFRSLKTRSPYSLGFSLHRCTSRSIGLPMTSRISEMATTMALARHRPAPTATPVAAMTQSDARDNALNDAARRGIVFTWWLRQCQTGDRRQRCAERHECMRPHAGRFQRHLAIQAEDSAEQCGERQAPGERPVVQGNTDDF